MAWIRCIGSNGGGGGIPTNVKTHYATLNGNYQSFDITLSDCDDSGRLIVSGTAYAPAEPTGITITGATVSEVVSFYTTETSAYHWDFEYQCDYSGANGSMDISVALVANNGSQFTMQTVTLIGGSAQEDSVILLPNGIHFDNEMVRLPIALNSNHRVFVDFQLDQYQSQLQILGNSAGDTSNFYVGLWNGTGQDRFYVRTSGGEQNTILSDYTARHTLDINNNGRMLIDGVDWMAGAVNTSSSVYYTIGFRGVSGANGMTGNIFRFYVYDTVNDEYLVDLRPARIGAGGDSFMYDVINKVGYGKIPKS